MKVLAKAKQMKRFADGGEVDGGDFVEAGSGPSEDSAPAAEAPAKAEYKSFKEAFAAERKAGNKTFEYMGKKYTTDVAAPRKEAAKPAADTNDSARAPRRYNSVMERPQAERDAMLKLGLQRQEAERAVKDFKAKKTAGYANGGVVRRATVKSHGKAC